MSTYHLCTGSEAEGYNLGPETWISFSPQHPLMGRCNRCRVEKFFHPSEVLLQGYDGPWPVLHACGGRLIYQFREWRCNDCYTAVDLTDPNSFIPALNASATLVDEWWRRRDTVRNFYSPWPLLNEMVIRHSTDFNEVDTFFSTSVSRDVLLKTHGGSGILHAKCGGQTEVRRYADLIQIICGRCGAEELIRFAGPETVTKIVTRRIRK